MKRVLCLVQGMNSSPEKGSVQVCPKKGIRDYPYNPVVGMGLNHQSYEKSGGKPGFLGSVVFFKTERIC